MSSGLALALLLAASATRLPPVDQCGGDPSFVEFRQQLRAAVERRDAEFVLSALDDDVLVDLGGGTGPKAFSETWALNRPQESRLWGELDKVLRLGCSLSEGVRLMPSFVAQFPDDRVAFETLIALEGAVLRAAPRGDAPIIARVSWELLDLEDEIRDDGWLSATRRGGRQGYVQMEQVRSPLDFRMTVEPVMGKWKITALVGGD